MRVGVATLQRGRHAHLAAQAAAVAAQDHPVDRYVVVSMDDVPTAPGGAELVALPATDPLPLAQARNRALDALADLDLTVLLDVDCVPAPDLVARYAAAAGDALLCGPVHYLASGEPVPPPAPRDTRGDPVGDLPHERFWSLSFAVRPSVHRRIGGFDETYTGYGGEDTDYAFAARAAGVPARWVPRAWAYHQHHPVSSPPREHLEDVVANARRFRVKWGRWPMEGWLRAFAADGLVHWEPEGDVLHAL